MRKNINNDEIIKLHRDGLSCGEISKVFNCNSETIRKRLIKLGVNTSRIINNPRCIYCESTTQKHGKTGAGYNKYKCNGCSKIFNDNTIKSETDRKEKYEIIKKMYLVDKLSTTEIGNVLGVSSTVPQRILKGMGVTRTISEAKLGKERGTILPVEDIKKMYQEGKSTITIANEIGFSKSSILKVLKGEGIDRDNIYEYKHEKIDDIEYLYLNGYSMNQICEKLSISYGAVNTNLHKLDIVRTEDRFRIGMNYEEYLESLPAYKKYRSDVMKVTNKQNFNELENNDKKRGLCGVPGAYQLDHKFSIFEGFKEGIEPEIIGNINNLEFIPWEENLNKGSRCSITEEELRQRVK